MPLFIKNFIEWFKLKIHLDSSSHTPPLFKESEIWWCSIGENVGAEISGKGPFFRRPILILRKLDRFSFIGLPLTSQPKTGSWYAPLKVNAKDNFVVLSQVQYKDYKRMDKILCTIPDNEFKRIQEAFINLIISP